MELPIHLPPPQAAAQQNPLIMEAITTKDLLHLRIEQADEKLLAVLAELTESLFKSYQPEVLEAEMTDEEFASLPQPDFKKMTVDSQRKELDEALAEYHNGEGTPLEELEKELEHAG